MEGPSVPVEWHADGILWLVNRVVFHPRGFALGVQPDGQLVLYGDGTELWAFGMIAPSEDALFAAAQAALARAAEANRPPQPEAHPLG